MCSETSIHRKAAPKIFEKNHRSRRKWNLILLVLVEVSLNLAQISAAPSFIKSAKTFVDKEILEVVIRKNIFNAFLRTPLTVTDHENNTAKHKVKIIPSDKDIEIRNNKGAEKLLKHLYERNAENYRQKNYYDYFDIVLETTEKTDDYTFTSYAPLTMQQIRNDQGINNEKLLESFLSPMKIYGENAGKSGAKLYLTHDEEYVIKTITDKENDTFRKMAPKYRQRMKGGSLLTVFLGSFKYENKNEDVEFVVMKNLASKVTAPYRKYDMKGIEYPQDTVNHPRRELRDDTSLTYMEGNFLNDYPHGLIFDDPSSSRIFDFLNKDLAFLKEFHIIDYSLLLIVKPRDEANSGNYVEKENIHGISNMEIDTLYHRVLPHNCVLAHAKQGEGKIVMAKNELQTNVEVCLAIIDILVYFSLRKSFEKNLKRVASSLSRKDPNTVTIQDVETYADRFNKFFKHRIFPSELNSEVAPSRTTSDLDFFDYRHFLADAPKVHQELPAPNHLDIQDIIESHSTYTFPPPLRC